MVARTSAVVALLCAMFVSNAPYAAAPAAQSGGNCAADIDRADRDLKEFGRELKKNNIDFISTDVTGASLTDIKSTLSGKPDQVITSHVQEMKEQIDGWVETAKNYKVAMDDILTCLNTKGCSMIELAKRQNAALSKWIKSLGDEGLTKASERVKEASSILQSFNNKALNMATGTMTRAANCIADKTQAPASTSAGAVDLRGTAADGAKQAAPRGAAPAQPTAGGGPSLGKALGVTALGAGAVAGGIIYGPQLFSGLSGPNCSSQESALNSAINSLISATNSLSACNSNTSCLNSRLGAVNSSVAAIPNIAGSLCACMGSTPVDAATKATLADLFNQMRSLGQNPGSLPSCFR